MPRFPQPHQSVRAPRMRAAGEGVLFYLENLQVPGSLYNISLTGGLAEVANTVAHDTVAEVVLETRVGRVRAVVQMLSNAKAPRRQPFRFLAIDDEDNTRLVHAMNRMQGI
ncbi:MAG TPA: hypothetical protein VFU76_12700 [Terriglobales bacterium]|nr:hypothetical protein [Terriglobales bacterium]